MIYIEKQKSELQINEEINDKEIRLIDSDGTMAGIVLTSEALELATKKNLDLVKISPNAVPPVCKIVDYNKAVYEKAKKDKESKKNQKIVAIKEVRLSAKIDDHDLDFKIKSAHKFLSEGNKVKVSMRFKGRQRKYMDDGNDVFSRFSEQLKEVGVIEKAPLLDGRSMIMVLSSKKL